MYLWNHSNVNWVSFRLSSIYLFSDYSNFFLGKADILRPGNDITLIAWGTQIHVIREVADQIKMDFDVDCEIIDLVSILPWDTETVCNVSNIFLILEEY